MQEGHQQYALQTWNKEVFTQLFLTHKAAVCGIFVSHCFMLRGVHEYSFCLFCNSMCRLNKSSATILMFAKILATAEGWFWFSLSNANFAAFLTRLQQWTEYFYSQPPQQEFCNQTCLSACFFLQAWNSKTTSTSIFYTRKASTISWSSSKMIWTQIQTLECSSPLVYRALLDVLVHNFRKSHKAQRYKN